MAREYGSPSYTGHMATLVMIMVSIRTHFYVLMTYLMTLSIAKGYLASNFRMVSAFTIMWFCLKLIPYMDICHDLP